MSSCSLLLVKFYFKQLMKSKKKVDWGHKWKDALFMEDRGDEGGGRDSDR